MHPAPTAIKAIAKFVKIIMIPVNARLVNRDSN